MSARSSSTRSFFIGASRLAGAFRLLAPASLFAAAALAATPASAQNLLDAIFGALTGQRPQQPVYREDPGDAEARRRAAEKARQNERAAAHRAAVVASGGVYGKMDALAPAPGVAVGSVEHFTSDKTLRSGDVVVTPSGFMIYRGGASFAPIGSRSSSLAALERASRGEKTQTHSGDSVSVTPEAGVLRATAEGREAAPD